MRVLFAFCNGQAEASGVPEGPDCIATHDELATPIGVDARGQIAISSFTAHVERVLSPNVLIRGIQRPGGVHTRGDSSCGHRGFRNWCKLAAVLRSHARWSGR